MVPGPSRSPYHVMPAVFQRVLLWQEHGFNEIAKRVVRATIKEKHLRDEEAMFNLVLEWIQISQSLYIFY